MPNESFISPYLRQPLRSYEEVQREQSERRQPDSCPILSTGWSAQTRLRLCDDVQANR